MAVANRDVLPVVPIADHSSAVCNVLLTVLIVVIFANLWCLRFGVSTGPGQELSFPRAVFSITNAATLTGFQQSVNPQDYKPAGQFLIFLLMTLGGLISLIVGGWSLSQILQRPYTFNQILRASVFSMVIATLLGATAILSPKTGLWPALFQSMSAFTNCGLVIGSLPRVDQWQTHLVLLPLGLIGGLGVPILLDLSGSIIAKRPMHSMTITVLALTAGVYVVGVTLVGSLQMIGGSSFRESFMLASAEVLNNRTLGLPTDGLVALARPGQWIILIVMLIGAGPAGTGGGIKITSVHLLFCNCFRLLRGKNAGPVFGFTLFWIMIYLAAVFGTTLMLVIAMPQMTADRLMFLAVSAVGNVGTSQSPLTLNANGLYALSLGMAFGRIAPLVLLIIAAKRVRSSTEAELA
jgi:Trk-type K+ transport system membrane component